MKTLYVTDLDGTLLRQNDRVSAYSARTINGLTARGMLFTYATARSAVSAARVTEGLSTHIPVIAYNGCMIVRPAGGELLDFVSFSEEERRAITSVIQGAGLHPLVYAFLEGAERVSWMPRHENEGIRRYLRLRPGDPRLRAAADEAQLFAGEAFYYTCVGEREELLPVYETLLHDGRFHVTLQRELYRPEFFCEVMPQAATKANAVCKLKTLYGCDRVVSFGDAINDIPMFEASDECYAVANAVPELRARADGVIGGNEEDGVARWLAEHAVF